MLQHQQAGRRVSEQDSKSDRNEHQQPENHSSIVILKMIFRKSPLKSLIYDFFHVISVNADFFFLKKNSNQVGVN